MSIINLGVKSHNITRHGEFVIFFSTRVLSLTFQTQNKLYLQLVQATSSE